MTIGADVPDDFQPVADALSELWLIRDKLRSALVDFCGPRKLSSVHKLKHGMGIGELAKLAAELQKARR